MSGEARTLIAVSIGCPAGVGPEVAVVAAAATKKRTRCLLVGDEAVVRRAMWLRGIQRKRLVRVRDARDAHDLDAGSIAVWEGSTALPEVTPFGQPDRAAGAAQLAWIDQATDLVSRGVADALATGPVSKAAIAASGAPGAERFRGHTEHLAERLGAREVVMAFWSEALVVALVTTHLPLASVSRAVDEAGVARATYWLARLLRDLKERAPRLVVAALNPHAGEGGLLGSEEATVIGPGVVAARARLAAEGIDAVIEGPLGAESALRLAVRRTGARRPKFDGVVAMYHDQATIPTKLLGFGDAVNVSLGLPLVRTSVDHGTGYDLAGTGHADASGMRAAIGLGAKLARVRRG